MTRNPIIEFLVILIVFGFSLGVSREREYRVTVMPPCPESSKNPIRYTGNVIRGAPNKYYFNGTIFIDRNISATPELELKTHRCSLDMRSCDDEGLSVPSSLCVFFTKSVIVYRTLALNLRPPLACPLRKGIYNTTKGYVDTVFMNNLPLMGYNWLIAIKLWEYIHGERKMIFCLTMKLNQLSRMKLSTTTKPINKN